MYSWMPLYGSQAYIIEYSNARINSLAPGRCENNFKSLNFKLIFRIDI